MELFRDRPLAAVAASFVAASVAAQFVPGGYKLWLLTAIVAILLAVIVIPMFARTGDVGSFLRARRGLAAFMCAASTAALVVSFLYMDVWYASWSARDGDREHVRGYVMDVVYETGYSGRCRVVLTEVGGKNTRAGALLTTDFAAGLEIGDEFSADVEFEKLSVDGTFDEERYYLPRGVLTGIHAAKAGELVWDGEHGIIAVSAARLRESISYKLTKLTKDGGDGIPEALLVGDRGKLDDILYRDFTYIGTLHLLAVSGMHLSILIGGLDAILRRVLGKTPRCLLLICLTIAYMALSGFTASVTRAGVMMVLYYLSHFARREADSVTSLFSAAALIMLFSPPSAADVGLLLSVTAMLGCLFAGELFITDGVRGAFFGFAKKNILCKCISNALLWIYTSLVISVSAMMFTLPVSWLAFGRISLLSPVATLLLTVPITLILYLCPFLVIFSNIGAVSAALSGACCALCRFVSGAAGAMAKLDGIGIALSGEPAALGACAAVAVCLCAALILSRRRARRSFALALGVFAAAAVVSGFTPARADGITYLNYKKNDSLIVADGGKVMICDISDGSWTPTSNAAARAKAERIDVYMLTHLHRRHVNTFDRLCRNEYVRELWLPVPEDGNEDEEEIYDLLVEAADSYGVAVKEYERGETADFGETSVITIGRTMIKRSTHPIIALAFVRGDESSVYVGSSVHESGSFDGVLQLCRDADEVIFGIHGPVYKSGEDFGLAKETRVIFATEDVAGFMRGKNETDEFYIGGE